MKEKLFSWTDDKLSLIVMAVMAIIIIIYQPIIGFVMLLIVGYVFYSHFRNTKEKNRQLQKYVEKLSEDFDSAAKHAIFNMPFPMTFIDELGNVTWYNTPFLNMLEEEDIVNKSISELIPSFNMTELKKKKENESMQVEYLGKHFNVIPNFLDSNKNQTKKNLTILYWVDDTEFVELEKSYNEETTIIAIVDIDNYEDLRNSTPQTHRPILLAEIDNTINSYFGEYDGMVRKYENDKYLVVMDKWALEQIIEKKFDILDQIRDLEKGNTIPPIISIGVCSAGNTVRESYNNAVAAIDIALGRGGDQAVVSTGKSFEFFGGKSKALEKRNKVKARVMADALRQLIEQSDTVFVMGHKNPDMDAIGSAIGIMRAVLNRDKEPRLVLNGENPSIKNLMDMLRVESPELASKIINEQEAKNLATEESLMIVVDNHKPNLTEAPELLGIIKKTVVIDHHRRGAEFIIDPVLVYLEPYASSTSELVTEILTYMSDQTGLEKFEAEALLAGITVDTKNFSSQTGVRTFEAASELKRAGADTAVVKQLFRDDFNTFVHRAEVVQSAKIFYKNIAVGRLQTKMEDSVLIAAQAANELLNINNVEASFVLSELEDSIHISGRSIGNISVQLILEKLGGGGHLTSAGAQLENISIEKAEEKLLKVVEQYLKDGEKREGDTSKGR